MTRPDDIRGVEDEATGRARLPKSRRLINEIVLSENSQEDSAQTVRVWGDAAVITAKLWEKGTENGKPFDYTVWFTDTYVRTATGWCYVFGQSSLPLTKTPE